MSTRCVSAVAAGRARPTPSTSCSRRPTATSCSLGSARSRFWLTCPRRRVGVRSGSFTAASIRAGPISTRPRPRSTRASTTTTGSSPIRSASPRACAAVRPRGERNRFDKLPEDCPPPFRAWDSFYAGDALIVHGHWARRGHYRGPRTIGLDSGCVYGGPLTAYCVEEDRVVQVRP